MTKAPDETTPPKDAKAFLEFCRAATGKWRDLVAELGDRLAAVHEEAEALRVERKPFALGASTGDQTAKAKFASLTDSLRNKETEADQLSDALEEVRLRLTEAETAEREADADHRLACARELAAKVLSLSAEMGRALDKVVSLNWERATLYDELTETGALPHTQRNAAQQSGVLARAVAGAMTKYASANVPATDPRYMAYHETLSRLTGGVRPEFAKSMEDADREFLREIVRPSAKPKPEAVSSSAPGASPEPAQGAGAYVTPAGVVKGGPAARPLAPAGKKPLAHGTEGDPGGNLPVASM